MRLNTYQNNEAILESFSCSQCNAVCSKIRFKKPREREG